MTSEKRLNEETLESVREDARRDKEAEERERPDTREHREEAGVKIDVWRDPRGWRR